MLGRLISDCEYYLGYGYRDPDKLWAHDEKEQIEKIKKIWLSFSELEKPEWLTWDQIIAYEKEMYKASSIYKIYSGFKAPTRLSTR